MSDQLLVSQFNNQLRPALKMRGISVESLAPRQGELLTDIAIEKGIVSKANANLILEDITGLPFLDPSLASFQDDFIVHLRRLIPLATALEDCVFAVRHDIQNVHLVMAVPHDQRLLRKYEYITGSKIKCYCCHSAGIIGAIERYYRKEDECAEADAEDFQALKERAVAAVHQLKSLQAEYERIVNEVAVIQLFKYIINHLVGVDSSDIHFEPQALETRIRYRKDGVMQVLGSCPSVVGLAIIDRIKILSGMRFETRDIPQDGRIAIQLVRNRRIDIRVSALPSLYGEKMVLRILPEDRGRLSLEDLGLDRQELNCLTHAISQSSGLILVTGPTGSGKTTTLYGVLQTLNTEHVNIVTAEDPVEYRLEGITQVNCDESTALDFHAALRSFLRQDPDIIMVGEIRDKETAEMALKAAMTGHLVLSTLHTNDAPGSINRLANMGIPAYLIASTPLTIIAQRLVRKICPHCRSREENVTAILESLAEKAVDGDFFKGDGCAECSGTGYLGRTGIYEIFQSSDTTLPFILNNEPSSILKKAAVEAGMTTLRMAALTKCRLGETSLEEVLRVTMDENGA